MAEEGSTRIQRNQMRGRILKQRSKVWDDFTRDYVNNTAKCKRCGKVYAYHGTKNLQKHYKERCRGQEQESADAGAAQQPLQPPPCLAQDEEAMQQVGPSCAPTGHGGSSGGESSGLQEEASKHLARMIALRGYDASVLEDDCFRSFVRSLNPEFEVPSRVAVENMCDDISDEARRDLLDKLGRAPGKVNVAVGRAKTMDEEVLYVACHFIDDEWNLHKPVLHAIVTTDHHHDHDGPILGVHVCTRTPTSEIHEHVREAISDIGIGIDDRLLMVAYEMTDKDIHTFAYGSPQLFATYVDSVLHSIARCLLPNEYCFSSDFSEEVYSGMRELSFSRQGRLELLAELDLHYGWAFDEQWYACYCSLEVLRKKGFLNEYIVTRNLLCKLWEKIYRAIQNISSSTRPTANLCLAELFKLREILQTELAGFGADLTALYHEYGDNVFNGGKDVTCVLKEACDTLDEAIEDSYREWSLPLALDPRYKLKYITFNFERAYGLEAAQKYVSEVTTMIMEMYADYVEEYGTTHNADHADGASSAIDITTSADDPLEQAWNEHCRSQQGMTTQVSSCYHPKAETELDRYLKDPRASQAEGFDILNWWKAHSSEYPMVARMARDVLAMPTCSKLSSLQMAQLRSILRGYSKKTPRYPN